MLDRSSESFLRKSLRNVRVSGYDYAQTESLTVLCDLCDFRWLGAVVLGGVAAIYSFG